MIFNIDAQVILGDSIDLSPFVISYIRTQSMCNVSHTGEIRLSPNVIDFLDLNEIDIQVYEPIRIIEYGKTVLTGYVGRISKKRGPAMTVSVYVSDKYIRAKDYYIPDPNWQTNGETLGGMFTTLCDLCGLDSVVDSPTVGNVVLPPGESIGLSTVDGTLQQLVAYGSGVIYTDGSGVVHLRHGAKDSNITFTTGVTTPSNATSPLDLVHGNVFSSNYVESDENARDVVSVWGYARPNPYSTTQTDLRIVATRSINLGLPVPKTSVYASSLIQTQAEAERLASVMIQELGKLEEVLSVECQGDPDMAVLKKAAVNVDLETLHLVVTKKITTVVSSVSDNGYVMTVTMDEFCPKFAGWSVQSLPLILYAGTVRHGVFKSLDSGHTWFEYNAGLPVGNKYVSSLGTTDNDEVMGLINNQIWYTTTSGLTTSGFWVRRYPTTAPVAGLEPIYSSAGRYVNVTSAGQAPGGFNVLMTAARQRALISGIMMDTRPECRAWVYHTDNAGVSWTGTLVHDNNDVSLYGIDMSSRFSTPYVITNRGSEDLPAPFPVRIQKKLYRVAYRGIWTPGAFSRYVYHQIDPGILGVVDMHPYTHLFGSPYYGVIAGGTAYKRVVGLPLFLMMNIPDAPGTELYSVQVYWQYSNFENPHFTPLSTYNMVGAYGEWSYQNWINLMGFGNIGQRTFPGYDSPIGNFAISDFLFTLINGFEWDYDNYRLWGDGVKGSVGISFLSEYKTSDGDPSHPDLIQVGTGFRELTNEDLPNDNLESTYSIMFDAVNMFWEFI